MRHSTLRLAWLLCAMAFVVAALLAPLAPARAFTESEEPWSAIGFSQGGLPLVVHHLGSGGTRLLLLGGQHGGPEANTVQLVSLLGSHFIRYPEELPARLGLDILEMANPDGLTIGSRQFLSGVDPNRNWDGADWQSDAWDSNGRFRVGLGGPTPFSEQETRALRDWIQDNPPVLVINYHSAGGFMFGGRTALGNELAEAYSEASGYYRPASGGGGSGPRVLGYRATGTMNGWLGQLGVPSLFIELTSPYAPEFERNLAGVRAVLARLAAHVG